MRISVDSLKWNENYWGREPKIAPRYVFLFALWLKYRTVLHTHWRTNRKRTDIWINSDVVKKFWTKFVCEVSWTERQLNWLSNEQIKRCYEMIFDFLRDWNCCMWLFISDKRWLYKSSIVYYLTIQHCVTVGFLQIF